MRYLTEFRSGMEKGARFIGGVVVKLIALMLGLFIAGQTYTPADSPSIWELPLTEATVGDLAGVFLVILLVVHFAFGD